MAWQNPFWIQLVLPVQHLMLFLPLFEVINHVCPYFVVFAFIIIPVVVCFNSGVFCCLLELLIGHKCSVDVATIVQGEAKFFSVLMLAWGM